MSENAAAAGTPAGASTPAPAPMVLSRGARAREKLEAISSWLYLIPLGVGLLVMYLCSVSVLIIYAYLAGCLVWAFWGHRMAISNPHLVICIDLESLTCRLVRVGRKYWATVTKKGRPWLSLTTPTGWSLEVVRSFDPEKKILEYPEDAQFSDAAIATIPTRYKDLIHELADLRAQVSIHEVEHDLEAQRRAQKLVEMYRDLFTEAMTPPSVKPQENPAAAAKPEQAAAPAAAPQEVHDGQQ